MVDVLLPGAQSLLLNDNLIMAIPVAVGMLTNLDELRIDGNDLKVCERMGELVSGPGVWLRMQTNSAMHTLQAAASACAQPDADTSPCMMQDPPANVIAGGIKAIRDYLGYNVRYETDQTSLAPPRPRPRIAAMVARPPPVRVPLIALVRRLRFGADSLQLLLLRSAVES